MQQKNSVVLNESVMYRCFAIAAYESIVNKPYTAVFHKKFFWGLHLLVGNIHFTEGDFLRWNKNCFCFSALLNAVMKKEHRKPLKILVVEDDPEILNGLNIALASIGFDVDVLQSGKPILQNQFVVPDLIIIDKRLPDIDGLEATRRLKLCPDLSHIPVIALTANAMHGDRERFMSSGCDAYIAKPIARNELFDTIASLLSQTQV